MITKCKYVKQLTWTQGNQQKIRRFGELNIFFVRNFKYHFNLIHSMNWRKFLYSPELSREGFLVEFFVHFI